MDLTAFYKRIAHKPLGLFGLDRTYMLVLEKSEIKRCVATININFFNRIIDFFKMLFSRQNLLEFYLKKFDKNPNISAKIQLATTYINKEYKEYKEYKEASKIYPDYNEFQLDDVIKFPQYLDWHYDENLDTRNSS